LLKDKTVSDEVKDEIWKKRAMESAEKKRKASLAKVDSVKRTPIEKIISFTGISDGFIEYGTYYGAVLEIPPVEFRFFSANRRANSIENGVGSILRSLSGDFGANIIKIERPVIYDHYIDLEYEKLEDLRKSYENGILSEEELKARVEVLYDRINELQNYCYDEKVVESYYYIVLFDSDKKQLNNSTYAAMENLRRGELSPHRLNDKELAVFLKYNYSLDFDEREIETIAPEDYYQWTLPDTIDFKPRTVEVNHIITHNFRLINYPVIVGDAWLAGVMSIPGTKVNIKCNPMDRAKAMRGIDQSLQELRDRYASTGVDSKLIELQEHIETLQTLLSMLQGDNEVLLCCNVYVTANDIAATRLHPEKIQPPDSALANIANMKKVVRRTYQESGFRLNNMEFDQIQAFIGSQVSSYDPMMKEGRGIPSNSIAASYPWIYSHVSDEKGIKIGSSDGVPVFLDFFRRDSERVNSNMVIVGKSGSGKSYATKSILSNLAADDAKIFILDPENEYTELAHNLHGKFINVGNAQFGRLNPFHIITALDDDEEGGSSSGSYATHLQFLEEFFRQILPDCEKDAMEYLNSLIDRMYTNMGITGESDLSRLKPTDYPTFDDLYDAILSEFQSTDNEYIRTMLRSLMNYVSKFSAGGRNANIWNGPSTITTDENFTVFNFQSLLANRNGSIANAQMLLVLKYIDNEIIKNRDYNTKYHQSRKVVVVIDEAHVFIDNKFPVALDFMFQLAKRIRKYNGMQIVITQNIKDFVGSEELARKSTAIINACQYSFIFSLSPNDMDDLCLLYEKAGGINENEQEQIISAPRGNAFTILGPQSRSSFRFDVPEDIIAMFEESEYDSRYFSDEQGAANWADFLGDSAAKRAINVPVITETVENTEVVAKSHVTFVELTEEEIAAEEAARADFPEIPDLPENPEDFISEKLSFIESDEAQTTTSPRQMAAAPVYVQPAADPQIGSVVSELRQMVQNLSQFSYESMMGQVRQMLNAQTVPAAAMATSSVPLSSDLEQTSEEDGNVLGSIFNEEAMAEAARLDEEENKAEETEEDEDDFDISSLFGDIADDEDGEEGSENSFDIMSLLQAEAETIAEESPIDLMIDYDEEVIVISLEELAQYNHKKLLEKRAAS